MTRARKAEKKYGPRDKIQRSFYVNCRVYLKFKETSLHQSQDCTSAFAAWLALSDYSGLREQIAHISQNQPVDKAVKLIREAIERTLSKRVVDDYLESLPEDEKAQLQLTALRAAEKLRQ